MKKTLLAVIALFGIALSFQSCKEDIELIGDFQETAVVYGLLDQADSVHMIKITRAFIGPGNALEIAQIPDSSYFDNVTGTVSEWVGGTKIQEWELKDTIVTNKDTDGIFYAPEQKLYYFESAFVETEFGNRMFLNKNAEYRLDLDINNGEFQVSGSTYLISGYTTSLFTNTQPFRFVDNNNDFIPTVLNVGTGNASVMNTTLDVEFTEWRGTTPTVINFDWGIGEFDTPTGTQAFTANGGTFYNLVRDHCTDDATIDKRTFNSITATFTGGSEDLMDYMDVNQPSSALAQSKPTFTNLETTNGHPVVGLFSSRHRVVIKKYFIDPGGNSNVRCLNKATTEYLCSGGVNPFFFCSDHPADAGESWACN